MVNNTGRKRAQSLIGGATQEELEEARAAVHYMENELNMARARLTHANELVAEKQRTIEVQQRAIDAQEAARVRFESTEVERVHFL
jgi:hypothetical protein